MDSFSYYSNQFLHFDNLYFQYQQGLISDVYWEDAEVVIRRQVEDPFTRAVYSTAAGPLRVLIRDIMTELELD